MKTPALFLSAVLSLAACGSDDGNEGRCPAGNPGCSERSTEVLATPLCDPSSCADGSEDEGCAKLACAEATSCAQTLPAKKLCDGALDCSDGSDESDCESWGFPCSDGTSVDYDALCDSKIDCVNGSDELDCEESETFTCRVGWVLPASDRCHGFTDCPDGSDELECSRAHHDGTVPSS